MVLRKLDQQALLRPGQDVPVHELERILRVNQGTNIYTHIHEKKMEKKGFNSRSVDRSSKNKNDKTYSYSLRTPKVW